MSRHRCTLVSVLLVQALALAPATNAAPVSLSEASPPPAAPEPAAAQTPQAVSPATGRALATGPQLARPQRKEEATPAKRSTAVLPDDAGGLDPDLKRAAKAARDWVHDAVPWSDDAKASDQGRKPAPTDGAALENPQGGPHPAGSRAVAALAERDFFVEVILFIRDLPSQPIAWVILALFGLGSLAVSFLGRSKRVPRTARLKGRSRRKAGTPAAAHPPHSTTSRRGPRHTAKPQGKAPTTRRGTA